MSDPLTTLAAKQADLYPIKSWVSEPPWSGSELWLCRSRVDGAHWVLMAREERIIWALRIGGCNVEMGRR